MGDSIYFYASNKTFALLILSCKDKHFKALLKTLVHTLFPEVYSKTLSWLFCLDHPFLLPIRFKSMYCRGSCQLLCCKDSRKTDLQRWDCSFNHIQAPTGLLRWESETCTAWPINGPCFISLSAGWRAVTHPGKATHFSEAQSEICKRWWWLVLFLSLVSRW